MERLLALGDNWDSYGARSPFKAAANDMLDVLSKTLRPSTPTPTVVPTPDGHFQAEWHINGVDLEIEVVSPLKIHVRYDSHRGKPCWENIVGADLTSLVSAIDELTA
jgi:hypothetical protein